MTNVFSDLRLLLGIFFILTGAAKLYPSHISVQVQAQMKAQVVKFAEVLSLKDLGYNPHHRDLLVIMGWMEFFSGLLLVIGPHFLQELSSISLLVLMMGVIYSMVLMKESLATFAPPTLCLGLLLLLIIRVCQRAVN